MPSYFDLAWLRAQLDTLGTNGLVAALEPPPDSNPDPARLALYQAALLASFRLQTDPSALNHQLYGRLHAHAHLPDIAALRAQMTLSLRPLQEPWLSQAGGQLISTSYTRPSYAAHEEPPIQLRDDPDARWIHLRDRRIISWSGKDPLRVWSADGEKLAEWHGADEWVYEVVELRDGRIVSCHSDGIMRLWSSGGAPLALMIGHTQDVRGVIELSDRRLLSWSKGARPRLWSPDGKLLAILTGHSVRVSGVCELTDGRLASAAESIRVWSSDGAPLVNITPNHTGFTLLKPEPGGLLRSTTLDGISELWDPSRPDLAPQKYHTDIARIRTLPDGGALTWSSWGKDDLIRWSADGVPLATLSGHTDQIEGAATLSDGRILSWSNDNTLRLWSSGGAPLDVLTGHLKGVIGARELPDGRILSWSHDYTLRLWSSDGTPLAVMDGHNRRLMDVCPLADGRILSAGGDRTLRLWSSDGVPLVTLTGHRETPQGVMELRDGRLLSWDKGVRLWSAAGEPLAALAKHPTWLSDVCELPDGRLIVWRVGQYEVMSDDDGNVVPVEPQNIFWLWSSVGEQLDSVELPRNAPPVVIRAWFTQHAADWLTFVRHVYPTDGDVLIWFEQHRLDVCDAASGESLTTIYTDSPITAAAMNGQTVIVGCKNGQVIFFRWTGTA